jgi:hypothetical protein
MTKSLLKPQAMRDARHLMRYLKAKAGVDAKEIAKSERVSLQTVNESIKSIEMYEQQNTEGQLQLAVRDLVISTIPQAKETFQKMLTAKELVIKKNLKTGKEEHVLVDDKTTQLEGMRLMKDLVIGMQPKTPMVAIQNNQNNNPTVTVGSSETNEERVRRLRKQAQEHNLLPAQVSAVPEWVDEGEDAPDDEHDEDEDE